MNCLCCGENSEALLCPECRTMDKMIDVFWAVLYFKEENCQMENVRTFVTGFEKPIDAKLRIPELLELFSDQDVSYYWCRYYRALRDERFEETALEYLKEYAEWNIHRQRVVYDLLSFYLRNDFIKPAKWCTAIRDNDNLCAELYETAAQFLALIGDYDDATQLTEQALCSNDFLFSNPENMRASVEKLRVDIERYRTKKPYWPTTEERRRKLAAIYDEKGIAYPRITSKPAKVAESDFEPIEEYMDELPTDYCTFWCSEAYSIKGTGGIYQIVAVKVRHGKGVGQFRSLIRPWDGQMGKKDAAKQLGVEIKVIEAADDVDLVMTRFFEFVGNDVLVSTGALGEQAKLISRAARYSGMKKIGNDFCDLLDAAADISPEFDMKNNTREYLLEYFGIEEGKDALAKAIGNAELCKKLADLESA